VILKDILTGQKFRVVIDSEFGDPPRPVWFRVNHDRISITVNRSLLPEQSGWNYIAVCDGTLVTAMRYDTPVEVEWFSG
jgi:hypothetical protein